MQDLLAELSSSDMETLFINSSGSDAEKLHQKLQELELYSGPIDGLFS